MYEIYKEFSFDAAHNLGANVPDGHMYARIHGHSFTVTVTLRGEPDPVTKWIIDLGDFKQALDRLHDELDHHYLNDVSGLEIPTMENICRWIWDRLKTDLPPLHRVAIKRGTLGEGCSYQEEA